MARLQIDIPDELDRAIRAKHKELVERFIVDKARLLQEVQARMVNIFPALSAGFEPAKKEWEELRAKEQSLISISARPAVGALFVTALEKFYTMTDDEMMEGLSRNFRARGRPMDLPPPNRDIFTKGKP